MKKFLKWLAEHLYIRSRDLQSHPEDRDFYEDVKPKQAVEAGIKFKF